MTTSRDIAVLGPLQLGRDGTTLGAKQRRLLAALVLEANRAVSADRLVHALWGQGAASAMTGTLHSHISRLRRHLENAASAAHIATAGNGYRLDVEPGAVDALHFEALLTEAHRTPPVDAPDRIATLREALDLWRGGAYADLADDDAAQAETARLDELRLAAREELAEALVADGRHGEALADLEPLVRQHPYRDRLWSALILARYRSGRQAEALDAFQSYRRMLDEELGLEPSAALVKLQQDVLEQAPHLLVTAGATVTETLTSASETIPTARSAPSAGTPSPDLPGTPVTELKLVTVLVVGPPAGAAFTDSHGALVDAHRGPGTDPEQLADTLERVLSVLVDGVHELGGWVLQAGPTGVTSVFGAPTAAEDHALRACLAAERLRAETAELLGPAGLSAGLDSGEVLLQAARTDAAQGFEAVGSPVERARRAQRSAPAGAVLVGPNTYRLAEGMLVTEPAAANPLDIGTAGDGDRQTELAGGIWRLLIEVSSSSAWDARARLGLSTLVGRDTALGVLTQLVREVEDDSGRVAGLVGGPGIGKSRLAYELAGRIPGHWSVLTVAASPLDVAVPFHPLLGPVRELLPPQGQPDGATSREPDVNDTALAALLGGPAAGDAARGWADLDPGVQRRRTIAAVADLFLRQAAHRPLLLLVEDAHWLDGETLAVLDALVDRISSAAVLLAITYRPEHDPGWANRPQFTLVRVDPLAAAESADLASALLGDDPSVQGLRDQLATWTGGVPLFLEESVRELTETRTLSGAPGGYVLDADAAPLRLPPRVHGVLAARIDRLPPSEKRLLQAAAVVGAEGALSLLAPVLGVTPDQVEEDLPGLQRADLLYERRHRSERRFVFKHALVHDTAYASLPRGQRRVMHARAMDAIVAAHGNQLEDVLERLAHHATQAERWAESVDLNQRAGERALARCAYREAGTLLTRAVESQRRMPPDPDREIDLLVQLRPALHSQSQFEAALGHLGRAEALAHTCSDPQRLLMILLHQSYVQMTMGHVRAALETVDRALALAVAGDDPLLVAECGLALGQCLTFAGDPRPAAVALERDAAVRAAAPLDQRLGMAGTRPVFALGLLGMSLSMLGEFGRAEATLAEADIIAATVDRPIDHAIAALGRGTLELQRGHLERAVPVLQAGHETCVETGMPLIARWLIPALAEARAETGDIAAAERQLTDLLHDGEASRVPLWQALAHVGLARTSLATGRTPDVVTHARQAIGLAETWGYPLTRATGLRFLAAATARQGDPVEAAGRARDARDEAARIGAVPEQRRAEALLAELDPA